MARGTKASGGSTGPKVTIDGKELVIRLPLTKPTPSTSGKSLTIASTRGNFKSELVFEGKRVVVGVNCYIPVQ